MSISFNQPINADQMAMLDRIMGMAPVAHDRKDFLYGEPFEIKQREMGKLANAVNQVVEVNIHQIGDTKTLSDGTTYQVTERGWKKVETK